MSDFIFSKKTIKSGILTNEIQSIYDTDDIPSVKEYHGKWGSLAVSENIYKGFQSYESDNHICLVIGGPVLTFQDNKFLINGTDLTGTKAIYEKMITNTIKWDKDLSGPFVVFIINKETTEVTCITDLMSFIPVYTFRDFENLLFSSHVDILARITNQQKDIDVVSVVDFILHGVVTYPYTVYSKIKQVAPASMHIIKSNSFDVETQHYWLPLEEDMYNSIKEAAGDLRLGIQKYVDLITVGMSNMAQFISGGEDSRVLSALLPKECKRDAYIFLDELNREGKVAKRAASAYGANFKVSTRSKFHYLDIMPNSVRLIGCGSQYFHAHTFGFHKSCGLSDYPAVFGGLFSDALLKGARIKKIRGSSRFPFIPQIKKRGYSNAKCVQNSFFKPEVLTQITKRRRDHLEYVKTFRRDSAEEWFELWPSSMNLNIPNLYVNRRLFRSYEPFMSNDIVKISALIPQKWKINRRVFHKAAKPLLKPTKWLLHGEGRLPYFPWYINCFVQFFVWSYYQFGIKVGFYKSNEGPWNEWDLVINSPQWDQAKLKYLNGLKVVSSSLQEQDINKLFKGNNLNYVQKINLLQTLYSFHK